MPTLTAEARQELEDRIGAAKTAALITKARRFESSQFWASVKEARARFVALTLDQETQIAELLQETHAELGRLLQGYSARTGTLRGASIEALRADVARFARDFAQEYSRKLAPGLIQAAEIPMDRLLEVSANYASHLPADAGGAVVRAATQLSTTVPRAAFEALVNRSMMTPAGLPLSQAIWNLQQYTAQQVGDVIARGVARGADPRSLAKQLEPFLVPGKEGKTWQTTPHPWKKEIPTPTGIATYKGAVSYNAFRLARTELFHAHKEAHARGIAQLHEMGLHYVAAMKYNLSSSHAETDICDVWAVESSPGFPPGEYLPQDYPIGHPNDMCHSSDALVSPEQFAANWGRAGGLFPVAALQKIIVQPPLPVAPPVATEPPPPASHHLDEVEWAPARRRAEAIAWANEHLADEVRFATTTSLGSINTLNEGIFLAMRATRTPKLGAIRTGRYKTHAHYRGGSERSINFAAGSVRTPQKAAELMRGEMARYAEARQQADSALRLIQDLEQAVIPALRRAESAADVLAVFDRAEIRDALLMLGKSHETHRQFYAAVVSGEAPATWQVARDTLATRIEEWGTGLMKARNANQNTAQFVRWSMDNDSQNPLRALAFHEYGHAFHDAHWRTIRKKPGGPWWHDDELNPWLHVSGPDELMTEGAHALDANRLSHYARIGNDYKYQPYAEYFAEAFSAYMDGRTELLNQEMLALIRRWMTAFEKAGETP